MNKTFALATQLVFLSRHLSPAFVQEDWYYNYAINDKLFVQHNLC